jgi:hypothetical protein
LPPHAGQVDLVEGQKVTGEVVRLPERGAHAGTKLLLDRGDEVVAFSATAKRGWAVLERQLADQQVRVGDQVAIAFVGWRETRDGARRYRLVTVDVLARGAVVR